MLDIKFVRENPDAIDVAMANRQTSWDREKFFELDDERRAVITEVEELQATRNAESKKIGALMKEGKKDEAEAAKEAVETLKEKSLEELAEENKRLQEENERLKNRSIKERMYDKINVSVRTIDIFIGCMCVLFVAVVVMGMLK